MIEKQLSIFLENKPGVLAEVCKTLQAHDINIRGISVSDTVDHAVVRMIVSDPHAAIHILGEHGTLVVETDVLAIELSDSPGELAKLASQLASARDQRGICLWQLRSLQRYRVHPGFRYSESGRSVNPEESREKGRPPQEVVVYPADEFCVGNGKP